MTAAVGEADPATAVRRYRQALEALRRDRPAALADLDASFAAGAVPEPLDGPYAGRFLASTTGALDGLFDALARAWMPWRGKVFDAAAASGRNRWAASARPLLLWAPGGGEARLGGSGEVTAFPFATDTGPSRLDVARPVLRVDYDLPANRAWPVRRVLDELVRVDDGRYLGQALVRWRGAWRRTGWFALEGP